ncbi:hypothetical protein GGP41_009235 [Bipolaris sorokiniana]|uniref:Uncharacterized protein n=1 Tax=Cochliobolus sativus TaxID=45130 RepID=A0A8H5ZF34_COCSA|nr:hypothetical protein GGP41_009235 [Bipolaris sorokiniana]
MRMACVREAFLSEGIGIDARLLMDKRTRVGERIKLWIRTAVLRLSWHGASGWGGSPVSLSLSLSLSFSCALFSTPTDDGCGDAREGLCGTRHSASQRATFPFAHKENSTSFYYILTTIVIGRRIYGPCRTTRDSLSAERFSCPPPRGRSGNCGLHTCVCGQRGVA